jgi:hypothetical protein
MAWTKETQDTKGDLMEDTLKTAVSGLGTAAIISLGVLPELVSIGVGVVTMIYIGIKIYKELN